jgi:catechol 2,3-dioxygenase-like lactoylglutathione lyase family enzyme
LGTGDNAAPFAEHPWRRSGAAWDNLRDVEGSVAPRLRQVVLDTTNPRASAEFWRQLLGLVYRDGHEPPGLDEDDPTGREWLNLLTPSGSPCLAFQRVDELPRSTWPGSGVPQQLHLDLVVDDLEELNAVHSRIIALGGEVQFDRSGDVEEPLRVYVDPDGHPFCVFVVSKG